jgi:hypothetical protein
LCRAAIEDSGLVQWTVWKPSGNQDTLDLTCIHLTDGRLIKVLGVTRRLFLAYVMRDSLGAYLEAFLPSGGQTLPPICSCTAYHLRAPCWCPCFVWTRGCS